jgi:hypothetical protein
MKLKRKRERKTEVTEETGVEAGAEAREAVREGDRGWRGGLPIRRKELQNDLIENHTSTRNKRYECCNIWAIF